MKSTIIDELNVLKKKYERTKEINERYCNEIKSYEELKLILDKQYEDYFKELNHLQNKYKIFSLRANQRHNEMILNDAKEDLFKCLINTLILLYRDLNSELQYNIKEMLSEKGFFLYFHSFENLNTVTFKKNYLWAQCIVKSETRDILKIDKNTLETFCDVCINIFENFSFK